MAGLASAGATPVHNPLTLHVFYRVLSPSGQFPKWLIRGSDNAYYGVTADGGISNRSPGTLYRIDATTGRFSVLLQFDSQNVISTLTLGSDGNLYGVMPSGLTTPGYIIRMSTTGEITKLYTIPIGGDSPSNLVEDALGNWYGTGPEGAFTYGSILEFTHDGVLKTLYNFTGGVDGGLPIAALLLASDGNLYGSTRIGEINRAGTLYRITPTGTCTTLHQFDYTTDGNGPLWALIEGSDDALYGPTWGTPVMALFSASH